MSRIQGERVFCHQCQNEWDRAHGGLTCPRCEGDFTEILEPGESRTMHDTGRDSPFVPVSDPPSPILDPVRDHPLRDHNPWADTGHDSNGPNFTTFEFTSNGGNGRMMFSTRTWRNDGHNNQGGLPPMNPFGFPDRNSGPAFPNFDAHTDAAMQPASLQDLFSLIMQSMQPGMLPNPDDRRRPGQFPLPFDLLNQMLNPANARSGDAVYSQEAFDRVMTQLMEQQNASTAPPPASEDAIRSLPKKNVDRSMLGEDGKAECSICMDNVEIGTEVTFLPCNHWFHGGCVTSWLKEHDTCPHCRKPITNTDQTQWPTNSRRRSRRASSVSSPRAPGPDGSRYNPFPVPESPSDLRNARQQYYGRRQDSDLDRPPSHRHSSSQSDIRRHSSRSQQSNNSGSRGGSNNGGGITGWLRDHLPLG